MTLTLLSSKFAKVSLQACLLSAATLAASFVQAGPKVNTYEVTITNNTPGQSFTPQLVVTHPGSISLFEVGEPASLELEALAEGGDTQPLTDLVSPYAHDVKTIPGLIGPGESTTFEIESRGKRSYISIAAMLLPTNDTFVSIDEVRLPRRGVRSLKAYAYDAGTEYNDQNCLSIPGPLCGGEALSEESDLDEGFVHISNGFHHISDSEADGGVVLGPHRYDWKNHVATIKIKRMR